MGACPQEHQYRGWERSSSLVSKRRKEWDSNYLGGFEDLFDGLGYLWSYTITRNEGDEVISLHRKVSLKFGSQ